MTPIGNLLSSLCARKTHGHSDKTDKTPLSGPPIPTTLKPPIPPSFRPSAVRPPLLSMALAVPQASNIIPAASLFPQDLGFNSILDKSYESAALELMQNGFAKGTIGNYGSALNAFTKFCDEHDITDDLCFPADERVLCAFVTSLNKSVSGSSAKAIFTGLKRWHEIHHVKWNGSERLLLMIRGVKNNTPASSKRPKRPPVTPRMLTDLDTALDHNDPKDSAILACAKAAFFGQARLGEFLSTSRLKHNPSTHPSRRSMVILLNNNSREIQLPKTKTNQADGESIFLTRQSDPLDPVKALEDHFRINHNIADSDHLFAYRSSTSRSGRHSLTSEDFMKRVNEIWSSLGYQRVTGHSFRIGGTTTLLRNGVPPDVVKELGRWSSDAFHEYWRDIPEIATRHVEFLEISDTNHTFDSISNLGQARRSLRRSWRHDGRNQRQGRPAFTPY